MGNGSWQYSPTGGSWSFANGGGISGMIVGLSGAPSAAPERVQIAFIQATGEISQSISGFQANSNYVITFSAAQRSNCCNTGGQDIQVYLDSDLKGTFHPSSGSYAEYSTAAFSTTTGAHTVKFVGLNPGGGDHTAFIDNVRINGSPKPGFGIQWLLTDQLGTPRMVFDESGGLNNVKRHDYLPFGEEVSALGLRTSSLGYSASDGVRQQFTQKERDVETGLDYSINRYYSPSQGRFTSPDPMNSSAIPMLPQTWNRYSYTINNPLLYTDPKGLIWGYHDHDGIRTFTWYDTFDESVVTAAGDTPYTQSQYFSNQAGTDAVYLGSNGNARHISQDEYAAGVVDEYLRGPESPLNDKEKGDLQRKFALRLKAEHPEWNFWAALFGGLAGGLAEGGAKGAEGAAAGGIDAEALTLSKTVEGHLDDITKFGTRVRPYGDSRLVMKEIMEAGKAVPDPGGVPGGLRWDVPGAVMEAREHGNL